MDAIPPELIPETETETAHTSGRKSALNGRIEILVRACRRLKGPRWLCGGRFHSA